MAEGVIVAGEAVARQERHLPPGLRDAALQLGARKIVLQQLTAHQRLAVRVPAARR